MGNAKIDSQSIIRFYCYQIANTICVMNTRSNPLIWIALYFIMPLPWYLHTIIRVEYANQAGQMRFWPMPWRNRWRWLTWKPLIISLLLERTAWVLLNVDWFNWRSNYACTTKPQNMRFISVTYSYVWLNCCCFCHKFATLKCGNVVILSCLR